MKLLGTKRQKFLIPIIVVSTALVFTGFTLVSFIAFLLILGWLWSGGNKSWLNKTIWVYIFFFCFLTLLGAVGSVASIKVISILPTLLLALATWLVVLKDPKSTNKEGRGGSWLGLLAALSVCVYVSIPIILHPSSEAVLRYSAKTTDDISHIARVEAIRSFGGLLYQRQAETTQLIDPGTASSPQGWHINAAYFEYLLIKYTGSDSIRMRLFSFLIYKTLWLFIAVFMLYTLLNSVLKIIFGVSSLFTDLLSTVGVAIISAAFLVATYGYGYQSFVAAVALVCASLVIAIRYIEATNYQKRLYLVALLSLTIASIYVWTLAGAIVGLITLAVAIKEFSGRYKTALSWWQWLILTLACAAAVLPVYSLIRHGSERGLGTLNVGGATPPVSTIVVSILFLLTLIAIKKLRPKKQSWLILLMSLTAVEFFFVAIYQQITVGEQRYYAVKLAFLVSVITSAVLLGTLVTFLNRSKTSRNFTTLIFIGVAAMLPFVLGLNLRRSAYPLRDSAPIKTATAKSMLDLSSSPDNETTVFYTTNKEETFLANKLWSSVNLYNSEDKKALLERLQQEINE